MQISLLFFSAHLMMEAVFAAETSVIFSKLQLHNLEEEASKSRRQPDGPLQTHRNVRG
jgi:hypothetical protein